MIIYKLIALILAIFSLHSCRTDNNNPKDRPSNLKISDPLPAGEETEIIAQNTAVTITTQLYESELIKIYPSYLFYNPNDHLWTGNIEVELYTKKVNSLTRRALLASLRLSLGISSNEDSETFNERAHEFLAKNLKARTLTLTTNSNFNTSITTGDNGRNTFSVRIPARGNPYNTTNHSPRWLNISSVLGSGQNASPWSGVAMVIPPKGWSIISDIDDTIKDSNVADKSELIRNTFTRPFKPVEGMAGFYKNMATSCQASFHYVSGSPWQLLSYLAEFIDTYSFPRGSFHLKNFNWSDESFTQFLGKQNSHKLERIEPILRDFPQRKFILIGDNVEQDAEIYAALYKKYPGQIAKIFIRNTLNDSQSMAKTQNDLKEVPQNLWNTFTTPQTLGIPCQI